MKYINNKLLKYRKNPKSGRMTDIQKISQDIVYQRMAIDEEMSNQLFDGIGTFFGPDGKYISSDEKNEQNNFYAVIDRIQNDKGLKLHDIAAQTGVSIKTLYNMQKQHREPGSGHATTISVINKVLKKYPHYKDSWEIIRTTPPAEQKIKTVKNAAFDLSIYETISILGNYDASYNMPIITSLDIGQPQVTVFPKAMLPLFKEGDPLYAINWNSPTYRGISYVGGFGEKIKDTNIYTACLDNWCLVKYKRGKGRTGNLYGTLLATQKKNVYDVKYFHDHTPGSVAADEYIIDKNIKGSDIEYALPYVMSIGKNLVDAWVKELLINNPQPPTDATKTKE